MELKDLFLTPIFLLFIYGIAYWVRPKATNKLTKKYFIPALTVKLIGAIGLGIIYQFYYGGGDTFNFFYHSNLITQAFYDSPITGIKLLFAENRYDVDYYQYTARMYWFYSPTEMFIAKLAGILGIFSFNTYSVIALFFALLSFSGMWAMYQVFFKLYPLLHKKFAIAIFFLPSVFFWGSGLMKDSITMGALGWLFHGFHKLTIEKKSLVSSLLISLIAAYIIYSVKVYILLCFVPPALFWVFSENNNRIKSGVVRTLAKPFFIGLGLLVAYFGGTTLTAGDEKYALENLVERTRINSTYLSQQVYTGSAYNIGTFDGSISSMIKIGPQAVVVSIYRPFLWEVRNPIMLLSAIEATIFIYLTLRFFFKTGFFKTFRLIGSKPILTFCLAFSLILAFGVGTNSGNFGTLVRYKIPLMPFYLAAIYIMMSYEKRPKKLSRLVSTA